MAEDQTLDYLLNGCEKSARHLEMRDGYSITDPAFVAWRSGERFTTDNLPSSFVGWHELVEDAWARGVEVWRARVVSEPVSEYIRFEYDVTDVCNIVAGEEVRWLPRRLASDLALPGNDCWIFDDERVLFGLLDGGGESVGHEYSDNDEVVQLCVSAFAAVWERAIPHEEYRPAVRS